MKMKKPLEPPEENNSMRWVLILHAIRVLDGLYRYFLLKSKIYFKGITVQFIHSLYELQCITTSLQLGEINHIVNIYPNLFTDSRWFLIFENIK